MSTTTTASKPVDNPFNRNPVERTIHETMVKTDLDFVNGVMKGSLVHRVYLALKEKGFLKDEY